MIQETPFRHLFGQLKSGALSRRAFIERATALGMGAGVAMYCANAVTAQTPSPQASPGAGTIPDGGTDGQERGAGGELKILQWQAPSQLNGLTATGDKDNLASGPVMESLLIRLPDGTLAPNLVTAVPSLENGALAEDLTSVTYTLTDGLLWSDGEPVTSADVEFTVKWAQTGENGAINKSIYDLITGVEVVDDTTITLSYDQPNPSWADSFTGQGSGAVLPKHVLDGASKDQLDAFRAKPIGTGPYKVDNFVANDRVTYVVNENYRFPNKPYFNKVTLKGGGDANAAARATVQTGEYDFAWNLAVEPDVAKEMESDDSKGIFLVSPGLGVERINFNFSDPNKEVDGQRSEMNTPNPKLSDKAVRQAFTIGVDRELIANKFFFGGDAEPAVANILSGIPALESPNTTLEFDQEKAAKLLDDAGWTMDGDVRKKDGVELSLVLYTTVSAVRQKIQAVVKSNLEKIGFKIDLQQIDSAVFFDGAAGNDQNNTHFYQDTNLYQSSVTAPPPVAYMVRWYSGGKDRHEVAQKSNQWTGRNIQRYINDDYDAVYEQAMVESDPEKSADLFIQMNDILYNDYAVMPLARGGKKTGISRRLNQDTIAMSSFEFDYWNIANWNLAEGQS